MLGEFGTTLADPKDRTWLQNLMAYTGTGTSGMSFTYWSWNPNSGDTGGILNDDWTTVNQAKQAILQPYLIPPTGGPTSPTTSPTSGTPTGSQACDATYALTNSWSGGFQASLDVKNTGTAAIRNWEVTFTLPPGATYQSGWNATFSQSGQKVTVKAPTWNPDLDAAETVNVGFTANGSSSPPPSDIAVNGTACV